jgi:catechol 2,3-dioxygenase-like lactoylglutathione lyase family enzyme
MKLGAFSVSLSVNDLQVSKKFYETLGFEVFAGQEEKNYLILKNGDCLIGIFQGMFEGNILTFNPGWDQNAAKLKEYDDIRTIQKHLKKNGISLDKEANENTSGPESTVFKDPDGNIIMLDQHV